MIASRPIADTLSAKQLRVLHLSGRCKQLLNRSGTHHD